MDSFYTLKRILSDNSSFRGIISLIRIVIAAISEICAYKIRKITEKVKSALRSIAYIF